MTTATRIRRPSLYRLEPRDVPAIFTVTSPDDSGPGSLREAVALANASPGPDTIDFGPLFQSGANTITLTGGQILITDSVSILAPSAGNVILSGNKANRIFAIDISGAGSVTLDGLTFLHGKTTDLTTAGRGGAIRLIDETLVIRNSVFTENTAAAEGGAICAVGLADVTITHSVFTKNSSTGTSGFHTGSGGAIALSNPATLRVQRSSLSGNTAARNGGAVYAFINGRVDLVESTLSGNTASGVGGGALYGYGTFDLVVRNSTLSGNKADGFLGAGGGVALSFFDGTVKIHNSTIFQNKAGGAAGGLAQTGGKGQFELVSSIVAGNQQDGFFGTSPYDLSFLDPVTISASHSLIGVADAGNFTLEDPGLTTKTGTQAAPLDAKLGALLVTAPGTTAVHLPQPGSPVIDKGANPLNLLYDQRGPGFARARGPAADIGAAELDSKIPSAIATPEDVLFPGGTVYEFAVTFFDDVGINTAKVPVVIVAGPNGFSQSAKFLGVVPGTKSPEEKAAYSITPPGGSWDFTDNGPYTISIAAGQLFDIDAPTPNSFPGGVVGQFRARVARNLVVTNANDSGPGSLRRAVEDANLLTDTTDTITFDPAVTGPILLTTGEIGVTDGLVVQGPGAANLTVSGGNQSRIFSIATGTKVTVIGLTLADGKSGTAPSSGSPDGDGGAIAVGNNGRLALDRVVVRDSHSLAEGGAIAVGKFGALDLRASWLSGNSASTGGAVYFGYGGSLRVEASTISGNLTAGDGFTAGGAGGGVYFFGTAVGTLDFINSTVSGNFAKGAGGGIGLASFTGELRLINSTLTANGTNNVGGGLARISGTGLVRPNSSILAKNTAAIGADLSFNTPADLTGDHNLIGVADSGNFKVLGTHNQTGTKATPLNPMLGDLLFNGGPTPTHALQKGGPAVDAGNNSFALAFDQRGPGFARVSGAKADIGAFELVQAAPPTAAVKILDGAAAQRSNVTFLLVTFSEPVTLGANPFVLQRIGSAGSVAVSPDPSSTPVQVKLIWAGDPAFATPAGSLIDGNYKLTIVASQVTGPGGELDGDGDGTPGGNLIFAPADFFRLFGDIDGNRAVNFADFLQFRSAFGSTGPNPPYNPAFDFDGNNQVNFTDFLQFRTRFGTSLAP